MASSSSSDIVIIHHSPCNDGHAAAACLMFAHPGATTMGIPANGKLDMSTLHKKRIFMVDVCCSVTDMNELSSIASHVVVLDHHVSNKMAFENHSWPNVELHFEGEDTAGCWMTYRYVFGATKQIPFSLHYIGLRDLYKHKQYANALYFTTAFECPKTWDEWKPHFTDTYTEQLITKGHIVYDYHQSILKTMAEKVEYTTWRGYRMAIINIPYPWISDIGDLLCEADPNTIAVIWNKGVTGPYNVSLRSRGPNVAKIAAEFKGGGHEHAAGFRTTRPPFELFNGDSTSTQ